MYVALNIALVSGLVSLPIADCPCLWISIITHSRLPLSLDNG
jgi:hypothetical protein